MVAAAADAFVDSNKGRFGKCQLDALASNLGFESNGYTLAVAVAPTAFIAGVKEVHGQGEAPALLANRIVEQFKTIEGFLLPMKMQWEQKQPFSTYRLGIERLIQYMTPCPFSLSRLVKVSDTGQVVYQSEKQSCRAFPDPKGDGMQAGVPRNFQILEPLDFLAEFTQHIPPKGSHLIRYYGWYSNKSRGMRKKVAAEAPAQSFSEEATPASAATGSSQAWAMLIKRVYEVDPLCCPECGGQMQVVSFIEPPQADVIEAILPASMKPADIIRDVSGEESVFLPLDFLLQPLAIVPKRRSFRECDIGTEQQYQRCGDRG